MTYYVFRDGCAMQEYPCYPGVTEMRQDAVFYGMDGWGKVTLTQPLKGHPHLSWHRLDLDRVPPAYRCQLLLLGIPA
jgi:hypothetical protein